MQIIICCERLLLTVILLITISMPITLKLSQPNEEQRENSSGLSQANLLALKVYTGIGIVFFSIAFMVIAFL